MIRSLLLLGSMQIVFDFYQNIMIKYYEKDNCEEDVWYIYIYIYIYNIILYCIYIWFSIDLSQCLYIYI